jgi:hypothetical protein
MEKRKSAVICIILVAVSLLGIFYTVLGGFSFLREEGSENKSISIRLASQQASYALREPVKVNVYIVNFSNETLRIHGGVASHDAVIYDPKGEFVGELITCHSADPEYYLEVPAQGEVIGDTVEWAQIRPSSEPSNSSKGSFTYVDPGIYTIRVTITMIDSESLTSLTSDARIEIKG